MWRKIYHYHIRKTGGTSLNESFFSLDANDPENVSEKIRKSKDKITILEGVKYVGANLEELNKNDYFYGFSHFPIHVYKPKEDAFTIVIFRDPVKRLISHYNMLLGMKYLGIERPWLKKELTWLGNSIVDFAERMPKEKLMNQLYNYSETGDIREAIVNIAGVSHVMMNEGYSDGIELLSSKLNMQLSERFSHRATVDSDILPRDINRIKDLMLDEIELVEFIKRKYVI